MCQAPPRKNPLPRSCPRPRSIFCPFRLRSSSRTIGGGWGGVKSEGKAPQGCFKLVPPALGLRNPKARDPKSETNPKPEARRCASTTRQAWTIEGPFGVRTSGLFRNSGLRISGFRPSQHPIPGWVDAALSHASRDSCEINIRTNTSAGRWRMQATGPAPDQGMRSR